MTYQSHLKDRIAACRDTIRNYPHDVNSHGLSLNGSTVGRELKEELPEGLRLLDISETDLTILDGAKLPKSLRVIDAHATKLHTIRNLDQLPNLIELRLAFSPWLERIEGNFPPSLWSLTVRCCEHIDKLPPLARTRLAFLVLTNSPNITTIPPLPETTVSITLRGSGVKTLPFLPDRCDDITLWNDPYYGAHYVGRAHDLREAQRKALRRERYDLLHESLMMAAWHPDRVSRWLEHSEETLDMMMGC
jgi:hypothetical protein